MGFNYNRLRGRIVEKFGTLSKFAMKAGICKQSMSLKLHNGIGLSQKEIINWCELLEIQVSEISEYFFVIKV